MRRLPIIIALLLLTACKRDVCNTPIGEVGRILLADYAEINNVVGGTVVLNRGHRGVIVRCESFGHYDALSAPVPTTMTCTCCPTTTMPQWCSHVPLAAPVLS